ncbi:hypothetical protein O7621_20215 [Solwaraspora sp. WMMD937]|uniref:hypothetical protein n=1 Tax=Solwaraspora sp. WMMD937 TaxID=3016090 RepID=UPI00249BA212|nr:hypothetical protein [Solwaraspora sp. WMMD937]WFE20209.1 hypothetical protein O7621_20215 [Solwaraspora sp. WMMD937]
MADPTRDDPAPPPLPPSDAGQPSPFPRTETWLERRRNKIAAEIARNRRGEYTVPTWVLATALALILGAWAVLIIVS